MNMTSPWSVQIAMLPVRRPAPDDIRSADPAKRENALRVAARRAELAQARIRDVLAQAKRGGMTADEIASALTGKNATGNTYRQLDAMLAAGQVQKRKISKNLVKWRLECR